MTEYLLDYDPMARAWNTFELHDGNKITIRRYWWKDDEEAILTANARQRLDAPKGGDLRHVANIPDRVQYEWLARGINMLDKNDQKKINQLLSSNEFYKLRTGGGRLG